MAPVSNPEKDADGGDYGKYERELVLVLCWRLADTVWKHRDGRELWVINTKVQLTGIILCSLSTWY